MIKTSLLLIFAFFFTVQTFATANFVYHEQTMNIINGTCGPYVSTTNPTSTDAVVVRFEVGYAGFTNRQRVYYTTDGSLPSGSHGVGTGTTQVLTASLVCTYVEAGTGFTVEVYEATIPAQPVGTTVNYIVSAWHTGSSSQTLEIFGNGGSNTTSATADDFSFSVAAALPLNLISFSGKKINNNVELSWHTQQELNVDHFEIYRSSNGTQFQSIGSKKAIGNSASVNHYSFNDLNTFKGNNFYKIKSVDRDGKYSFTQVVKLSFDNRSLVTVHNYGNILHITLASTSKDKYLLKLVNNLGQVIHTYNILHDGINTSYDVNLPAGLSRNIYYISVSATDVKYSQSIMN
jgi:hypothetical protein